MGRRLGEREVTRALLGTDHHLIRGGPVIPAARGFAGRDFAAVITSELGGHLIRPDRKDEPARFGKPVRCRPRIEAISGTLTGQLSLEDYGGRTLAGVRARVAARLPALAAAIWHNWRTGAPARRPLLACDRCRRKGLTHAGAGIGTNLRAGLRQPAITGDELAGRPDAGIWPGQPARQPAADAETHAAGRASGRAA